LLGYRLIDAAAICGHGAASFVLLLMAIMDHSDTAPATTPANAQRVLVLQGGGALGSYQAGAFHALCRAGFDPEWIAGISIGAINAAIIAGNEGERRVDRL
jgi:NTE family protein